MAVWQASACMQRTPPLPAALALAHWPRTLLFLGGLPSTTPKSKELAGCTPPCCCCCCWAAAAAALEVSPSASIGEKEGAVSRRRATDCRRSSSSPPPADAPPPPPDMAAILLPLLPLFAQGGVSMEPKPGERNRSSAGK